MYDESLVTVRRLESTVNKLLDICQSLSDRVEVLERSAEVKKLLEPEYRHQYEDAYWERGG